MPWKHGKATAIFDIVHSKATGGVRRRSPLPRRGRARMSCHEQALMEELAHHPCAERARGAGHVPPVFPLVSVLLEIGCAVWLHQNGTGFPAVLDRQFWRGQFSTFRTRMRVFISAISACCVSMIRVARSRTRGSVRLARSLVRMAME